MKVYIELSNVLHDLSIVEQVMVFCFFEDKVILQEKDMKWRFPEARFDRAEALEKTVRRELYEQTGALLKHGEMLGLMHFDSSTSIPIYVGTAYPVETPVLRTDWQPRITELDDAYKMLKEPYRKKTKAFLFYHAHKRFKELEGGKRFIDSRPKSNIDLHDSHS